MANMVAALLLLLILLVATPAIYAVQYTVGDSNGWTQGVDYTTWVSGKTFFVGDALLFSYGPTHKVDRVIQSDYNNCVSSNALESHSDGNTIINLTTTGATYFICPTPGHCPGGMKLAVTVTASPGTSPSGSPPSPGTTSSPPPPPPPPHSAAANIFCNVYNMMAVLVSLVVVVVVGLIG